MESPETLLEHATWLRRLAASLVGDRALADDVVQDTWLAALRQPPRGDRPMRPWLARVARNAARFRWRSDTNRAGREAAVARETETATPSSEDLLARHQLQQLLAKLVTELDEPFRATILFRYAEGLEPSQIARRLSIPASTVRWRIKEGLDRLRSGLDDAHGGNRKTWLLALAPIALWPRASHAAPAAAAGTFIAILATVALVVLAARRHSAADAQPEHPSVADTVKQATAPRGGADPSWFVQPSAAPRHVTGRVMRDGAPVPNAKVHLVADGIAAVETHTDARGRFDLGEQAAREVTVGAAAGDALAAIRHVDLRDPTQTTDLELTLVTCNAWITGKVTDAGGNAIPHAKVLREDTIGTETAADGAYELCALPTAALVSQLELVVRADGYGAIVAGVAPTGRSVRDFVLAPEATITGRAAPNAAIWIDPDRDETSRTGERAARQVTTADADGRFHFAGAGGGRYQIGGAARGMMALTALVSVEPGGSVDVVLRMVPAATVRGRLMVHGAPLAGAHVEVRSAAVVVRHDDPSKDQIAVSSAVTQADGSFVLDGVPAGRTSFGALPVRVVSPPVDIVAGENSIILEGEPLGRIRGFVRRHGVPVPFARVDIGGIGKRGGLTADGAGHYEIDGLEPGSYGFYADDARRGAYFTGGDLVKLGAGETRDYDIELAWGARIAGTVVDRSGAPVANLNVRFFAAVDGEEGRCTTDIAGAFTCASLQGDKSYAPAVFPGNTATRPFLFATPAVEMKLDADGVVDGVVLEIDSRTTSISGGVVDESGAPAVDARVRLRSDEGQHDEWVSAPTTVTDEAGHFRFDRLPPGSYELFAEAINGGANAKRTVIAGTGEITLALARPSCVQRAPINLSHKPSTPVVWDDRIELLGWDMPATARVGEPVSVTVAFRVRAPLLHSWLLFAHFDGSEHRQNADHAPVGDACGTSTWKAGDVLVDRFTMTPKSPDTFTLRIGFYRRGEGDGPRQNLSGPEDPARGVALGPLSVM